MKFIERLCIGFFTICAVLILCWVAQLMVSKAGGDWPKSSQDWAGWAQAVGSIAAIGGAFIIGNRQSERARLQAIDMDEREIKRKHAALGAILDDAYTQCARLRGDFQDTDDVFGLLSFLLTFDLRSFDDVIANIERIPLHEVDSYELVSALSGMRNRLISIKGMVQYAMDKTRDQEDSPDWQVKEHSLKLINEAEWFYCAGVAALGRSRLTKIAPYAI